MEKKPFSTRQKARIALFVSAIIIVLGITSISQTIKANRYKQEALITKLMLGFMKIYALIFQPLI